MDTPKIIWHRGVAWLALENTLSSFQKAVALGVDYIETDIRELADGNHIIFHDHLLSRLCDIHERIPEKTLDEIKAITLSNGEKIMTLEEYLDWVSKYDVCTLFELKWVSNTKIIYEKISKVLHYEKYAIQSFFHDQISYLKILDENIMAWLLFEWAFENIDGYLSSSSADFVGVWFESVNPDFIKAIKRSDKKIAFWTIDNLLDLEDALQYEPWALISNRPDILLEAVQNH